MRTRILQLLTLAALVAPTALAQTPTPTPAPEAEPAAADATKRPILADERFSETSHAVRIGDEEVRYKATAGQLVLRHPDGKARANMFFVAYNREGAEDRHNRPITFAYNGGPGSATIWLHMGVLGPKRVQMADEGFQPAPFEGGEERFEGVPVPGIHILRNEGAGEFVR